MEINGVYNTNEIYEFFFTKENNEIDDPERNDAEIQSPKKKTKLTEKILGEIEIELNNRLEEGGSLQNALESMKKYANPKTIHLKICEGKINIDSYKIRYRNNNGFKYDVLKDPRVEKIIKREKSKNSSIEEIIKTLSVELSISEDTINFAIRYKNYPFLNQLNTSNTKRLDRNIEPSNVTIDMGDFAIKLSCFNFPSFLNSLCQTHDYLGKKNIYITKIIKKSHRVVCDLFINKLKQISSEFLSTNEKEMCVTDHKITSHFIIEIEETANKILKNLDKKNIENLILLSNDLLKKMESYFHYEFQIEKKCITATASTMESKQNFPGFSINFIRNLFFENICEFPADYDINFQNLDYEEIMKDVRLYIIKHWDKKESMYSFLNAEKFLVKFPKISPKYVPFIFSANDLKNSFFEQNNDFKIGVNRINLKNYYAEDNKKLITDIFHANNFSPIWEANKYSLITKSLNFVNEELSNLSAFTQPILKALFCKFTERFGVETVSFGKYK